MRRLARAELGGRNSDRQLTLISTVEIEPGLFETMVMVNGFEADCFQTDNEVMAKRQYGFLFNKYAEPLQKAVFSGLRIGKRYTLVYWDRNTGMPVAQKITLTGINYEAYAQYSDAVKLSFRKYKARQTTSEQFVGYSSLIVFDGWQDLPREATMQTVKETSTVSVAMSKYRSFDVGYIEDAFKYLEKPVVVYKNYKKGKNGGLYA